MNFRYATLSYRLTRRFVRGSKLGPSVLIVFVSTAFLMVMYTTLSSLALTGEQRVERDLGRFSASSSFPGVPANGLGKGGPVPGLEEIVRGAGASEAMVSLSSFDVPLSGVDPPLTPYFEAAWATNPFPDRFTLQSGRWPARPGEVAVTSADTLHVAAGARMSVLAGHQSFIVVGTVHDRYLRTPSFLAGPGTWNTFSQATLESFPGLQVSPTVYWRGAAVRPVARAIHEFLTTPSSTATASMAQGGDSPSILTRQEAGRGEPTSWLDRVPAAYTLPGLALPLLSVFLVFGVNDRKLRRSVASLSSVGIRRSQSLLSLTMAVAAWVVAAIVGGLGTGIIIGLGVRPLVQHFWGQPLSPLPALGDPIARVLLVSLLAVLMCALSLRFSLREQPSKSTEPAGREGRFRGSRHVVATLAACASVLQIPRMDSPARASVFAASLGLAILLLTPEVVERACRILPGRDPRVRLGRRQLQLQHRRTAMAVAVIAAGLGMSLGFFTLLDTSIVTADAGVSADVAPGQVAVAGRGGYFVPAPENVVSTVENVLPSRPKVQLRYLVSGNKFVFLVGTNTGLVLAFDTPRQVAGVINQPLTHEQRSTLRHGGLLVWDSQGNKARTLVVRSGSRQLSTTAPLPTAETEFSAADWKQSARAITLTSTAKKLGLPRSDGAVFFLNVPEKGPGAAKRAVLSAGLDVRDVLVYQIPKSVVPPFALYLTAIGLASLTLFVSIAVARSQVSSLRGCLGALVAIGLSPRWARQVLLLELGAIIALGTILGLLISVPPIVIAAWKLPGFVLSVPWTSLTLMIGVVYGAVAVAGILSSRRLGAGDRVAH